ncbi:MAG TPA: HesA/MoeB/ThiF family protein, partial [Spirochaetota bacterium]|nr:HesA/MoeB/ThiF family protein [Spirochaetota bacterium]
MSYNFTQEQLERYKRNINLKEIGLIGQEKILNAKVLIIGAGGLGSSASLYLAALGIGTLGIVDKDKVELSNLQRQIIHNTLDLDKPKVISAKEKITNLNPDINVITYDQKITKDNIMDILINYNFIIDA